MAFNLFLSVVVPVYNEAEALPKFIERLTEAFSEYRRSWEVVFVDDGSTDGSADLLRDLRLARKNVKVVSLDRNYGREAALCAGFHFSEGALVVQIPADLQYDPADIHKLLEAALTPDKPDLVAGYCTNRVAGDDNASRKIDETRLAAKTAQRLKDPVCSFRLYGKTLIDRAESYNGNTYSPSELLPRMCKRPVEVAIERKNRVAGQNKLPRGVNSIPRHMRATWNTFDILAITAIVTGIILVITALLSALILPMMQVDSSEASKMISTLGEQDYFKKILESTMNELNRFNAIVSRFSLVLVIIGLFAGIALSAMGYAMRRIALMLLPLPEPVRYNTIGKPTMPQRKPNDYRRGRQRRPDDRPRKPEPEKQDSNGKQAPAEKSKPTGPVTLESVVLNDENRRSGPDRPNTRQHPRSHRDDSRNDRRPNRDNSQRQRGPSSTYDPDN